MKKTISLLILLLILPVLIIAKKTVGTISLENTRCDEVANMMRVATTLRLDSVRLGANEMVVVTPILEIPDGEYQTLPSVMIDGRNMHYQYERRGVPKDIRAKYSEISTVVRRANGKEQSVDYSAEVEVQKWMKNPKARLTLAIDTCGCGHLYGRGTGPSFPLRNKPIFLPKFRLAYITPEAKPLPVTVHEGKAKVQFEVDRTELHTTPYRTKKGQLIDNVAQLKMIDDTVTYALSDPNVEIAGIDVCGYASPESPYSHNDYLATGRSRALAEYLAQKYNLPAEKSKYSAVPENWSGFREQTLESQEITEEQRKLLLDLIDAPTYGPRDFDAKEKTLKTDPRYKKLYSTLVLPKWFPDLRVTHFAISTSLKPLDDLKLAEVIKTNPELLTLNQMFRVANLYEEGSDEFNETIETALKYFPDDPVASLNAAVAAIKSGNLERAALLLEKAGHLPEAENARGVLKGEAKDYEAAKSYFKKAGNLPAAVDNLKELEQEPEN